MGEKDKLFAEGIQDMKAASKSREECGLTVRTPGFGIEPEPGDAAWREKSRRARARYDDALQNLKELSQVNAATG